ncbi:MAG: bifunctional phosphoglucose/phosphomannose isomerase [Candidatus Diapherotrites archaeon]
MVDYKTLAKKYDKKNTISFLRSFPEQCRDALEISSSKNIEPLRGNYNNIFIQGMGGSGISGAIARDLLKDRCPLGVYVSNSYDLPEFVNEKTLCFFVSYSGNTEETISSFEKAGERLCTNVCISSDGILLKNCNFCIKVPAGNLPRNMLGYLTVPLLVITERLGLTKTSFGLESTITFLENELHNAERLGRKLAKVLYNKIPVLYAADKYSSLVWRVHGQLAENAGVFSHCNVLPEMNHNEIVGFRYFEPKLVFLFFRDCDENEKMKKRFEFTKKIVSKKSKVFEIALKGKNPTERLFYGIMVGDFTSYYLALLNKKDPSENENITKLKQILSR